MTERSAAPGEFPAAPCRLGSMRTDGQTPRRRERGVDGCAGVAREGRRGRRRAAAQPSASSHRSASTGASTARTAASASGSRFDPVAQRGEAVPLVGVGELGRDERAGTPARRRSRTGCRARTRPAPVASGSVGSSDTIDAVVASSSRRCMHTVMPFQSSSTSVGDRSRRRRGRHRARPTARCRGGAASRRARAVVVADVDARARRRPRAGGRRCRSGARVAPVLEVGARRDVARRDGPVGAERMRFEIAAPAGAAGGAAHRRPLVSTIHPRAGRRSGTTRSTARRGPARRCRPGRAPRASVVSSRAPRRRSRARSSASRTRSMPSSAGGAARGSSTVQTFSLPIATPCSLTPCSAPHSHVGRDTTAAAAPGSGSARYCVCSVGVAPAGARPACDSTTCASSGGRSEFFANSVPVGPTTQSVSHMRGQAVRELGGEVGRV